MMGAVLHMVNVRLSPEQILYTINHAEDDVILVNAEFLPILEAIHARIRPGVKLRADRRWQRRRRHAVQFAAEYESLLAAASPTYDVPHSRRGHARHDLLHDRHDGPAQGRLLQPPPARAAHARGARRPWRFAPHATFTSRDVYMPITPMFHVHAWGMPYVATTAGREAGLSGPLRSRYCCCT